MSTVKYSFPIDSLPIDVGDAYDVTQDLLVELFESISIFSAEHIIHKFDKHLNELYSNESKLSYIRNIAAMISSDIVLAATKIGAPGFKYVYTTWLAVRITDVLGSYIGNSRLRMGRSALQAEWDTVSQNRPLFRTEDAATGIVLQFVFGVLVPYARSSKGRSSSSQVATESPRKTKNDRPTGSRTEVTDPISAPQSFDTLFINEFNKADLRELLTHLGVLDEESGKWKFGNLVGKGAKPKSAFPAAYRALTAARPALMRQTEAPVWRKFFEREYGVSLSDRLATYSESNASTAFHDYFAIARSWIVNWKAPR